MRFKPQCACYNKKTRKTSDKTNRRKQVKSIIINLTSFHSKLSKQNKRSLWHQNGVKIILK